MGKRGYEFWILTAVMALTVFTAGFFVGRNTLPYEIAVGTQTAAPAAETPVLVEAVDAAPVAVTPDAEPETTGPINLNTAQLEQLQTLPGIGEVLAQRILNYRQTYGKFTAPEQIMDVEGIGEQTYEKLKDLITVED